LFCHHTAREVSFYLRETFDTNSAKSWDHVKDFTFNSRVMMTQSRWGGFVYMQIEFLIAPPPRSRNEFQI
jgi:hypothetical protein